MERDRALDALLALAQETRLDAYRLIAEAGPRGIPARELAARLRSVRRTVAEQVSELAEAGLVAQMRAGDDTHYAAEPGALRALFAWLPPKRRARARTARTGVADARPAPSTESGRREGGSTCSSSARTTRPARS